MSPGYASRPGGQTEGQRHLSVGHRLLGQVIVDDEHMTPRVLRACGLAVFAVVDEVLTHCSTSHRSDVLQRSRVGGGGGDYNRLIHNAVLLEGLHDAGNRRGLLANSDIDADHVVVFLVDNGIDRNSSLAGLTVANDELALATADRNHRVNSDDTGLHGLMHGLAADNARSLELDGAIAVGLNGAFAVDGHAKRVHNAAEKTLARRHFHDLTGWCEPDRSLGLP